MKISHLVTPTNSISSDGIYSDDACSTTRLTHAVLVVGYGTNSDGEDYWILKNSWGKTWGETGYIRMARNENNMCGIASRGYFPRI